MIKNNGKNNKNDIKHEDENNQKNEKTKKVIQTIQLLIRTLSVEGLKEIQNEIYKLLSDLKN